MEEETEEEVEAEAEAGQEKGEEAEAGGRQRKWRRHRLAGCGTVGGSVAQNSPGYMQAGTFVPACDTF